ncbi:hypothetical protein FHG87_002130 [Trinorchestia longiramus]|nr:hypothetical protein FHG87_002130 [Trinorchestia longiramus]
MVHQISTPSRDVILLSRKSRPRAYPHILSWGALKEEAQKDSLPSPKSSPKLNHHSPTGLKHRSATTCTSAHKRNSPLSKFSRHSPPTLSSRSESRKCDVMVSSTTPVLVNRLSDSTNRQDLKTKILKSTLHEATEKHSQTSSSSNDCSELSLYPNLYTCTNPNTLSTIASTLPFPSTISHHSSTNQQSVECSSCSCAVPFCNVVDSSATTVVTQRNTGIPTHQVTNAKAGLEIPLRNSPCFGRNSTRGCISTSSIPPIIQTKYSCQGMLPSNSESTCMNVAFEDPNRPISQKNATLEEYSNGVCSKEFGERNANVHDYNSIKTFNNLVSPTTQQGLHINPKSSFQSNEFLEDAASQDVKLAETVSLDLLLATNACGNFSPYDQDRFGLNSSARGHSNLTHPLPRQLCRGQRPRASCNAKPSSKSAVPYQLVSHASRCNAPKSIINEHPKLQLPESHSGFAPPPGTPSSLRGTESSSSAFPLFSSISQGYRTKNSRGLRDLRQSENSNGMRCLPDLTENNIGLAASRRAENSNNCGSLAVLEDCVVQTGTQRQPGGFSSIGGPTSKPQPLNGQSLQSANLPTFSSSVDARDRVKNSGFQNSSSRFKDMLPKRNVAQNSNGLHDNDDKKLKYGLPKSPSLPRKTSNFPGVLNHPETTVAFSRSDTFYVNDSPCSKGDVCFGSQCFEERGREREISTSQVYYESVVVSGTSTRHQLLPVRPFGAVACQNKSYLRSEQVAIHGKKGTGSGVAEHHSAMLASKRSKASAMRHCDDRGCDRRIRYGRFFSDDKSSGMSSDYDASREQTPQLKKFCTSSQRSKLRKSRTENSLLISTSSEEGISPVCFKTEEMGLLQEGTKGGKAGLRKTPAESHDFSSSPRSKKFSVSADDDCSSQSLASVSSTSLASALPVLKSSNENKKTNCEPKTVFNEVKKSTNEAKKSPFDNGKKAFLETKQPTSDGGKSTGEPRRFTSEAAKRLSEAGRRPHVVAGTQPENAKKYAGFNISDSAVYGSRKSPSKLEVGERVRGRSVSSRSSAGTSEARDIWRRPSVGQRDSMRRTGVGGKLSSSLPRYSGSFSATAAKSLTKDPPNKSPKDDKFSKRATDAKGVKSNGSTHRTGGRTATVTPSEVTVNKRSSLRPLARFGFNDTSLRSSDSTESVNSILSDANTVSDSNSNILEFYEENSNANGERGYSSSDLVYMKNLKNNLSVGINSVNSSQDVIIHCTDSPKSPTSISQASSGVTSSSNTVTARLKAQSRVLPQLQLPSVKSLNSSQANKSLQYPPQDTHTSTACQSANKTVPVGLGQNDSFKAVNVSSFLPQPSSAQKASQNLSSCPVTFKAITSGVISKSTTPSPVEEKENASPKSVATVDSGLGSSMEGDKFKTVEKPQERLETSRQRTPSVGRSTEAIAALQSQLRNTSSGQLVKPSSFNGRLDVVVPASESVQLTPSPDSDSMKLSIIDESDKWLREKKNRMGKASKLQTGSLLKPATKLRTVFPKVELLVKAHPTDKSSCDIQPSELTSEEPDTYLSYGAVRQKFVADDRSRSIQRSETSPSVSGNQTGKIKVHKSPSDPGRAVPELRVIASSKLPQIHNTANKVTNIRPTSLVKNPILVTPVSNEVVELSKPILKRLEYTEGHSSQKDHAEFAAGKRMTHRKNSTEDLLMVSCTELQGKDAIESNKIDSKTIKDSRDIEFSKKLNHKSSAPSFNVLESPTLEVIDPEISSSKLSVLSLESPSGRAKEENKVSSPGSETSFEVLDTPSEGLEDANVCNFVSYQDPRGEEDATQDLRQQMMDLQCHQIGPEALGSHSSEERALIDSFIGSIQPETDSNDDPISTDSQIEGSQENDRTCEDTAAVKDQEKLALSLEKSLLVESLTNVVMSESLEESATASMSSSITSREVAYTNDPSSFYNITIASLSLPDSSGDKEQHCENPTESEDAGDVDKVQNFMNNLINSKLEIVDILNNLSAKHRDDTTESDSKDKESTPNSSKESLKFVQTDLNLSKIDNSESNSDVAQTSSANKRTDTTTETQGNVVTSSDHTELLLNSSTDSGPFSCTTPTNSRQKQSATDSFSNGVNSSGVDMDQDFLIDDEISDQPDLTFIGGEDTCTDRSDLGFGSENLHYHGSHQRSGVSRNDFSCERNKSLRLKNTASSTPQDQERSSRGERSREDILMSVASDEGIFGDDLEAPSPCHAVRRIGRAVSEAEETPSGGAGGRPDSVCTLASSLDPDDFMLDFDVDDFSTNGCATPSGGVNSNGCIGGNLRGGASANSSLHSSPHHYSTKRSTRNDSGKPTRLPVLRPAADEQAGVMDRGLQQQLMQDCHATKTMLLQLRTVLLNSDTGATATSFALTNKCNEDIGSGSQSGADRPAPQSLECLIAQNTDLRRQIAQLEQQMEEREKTVRSLQRQLHQNSSHSTNGLSNKDLNNQRLVRSLVEPGVFGKHNAATQTDRTGRMLAASSLTRQPSVDDGLGPTVSSEESDCATPNRSRSLSRTSCVGTTDLCSSNSSPDDHASRTTPPSARSSPFSERSINLDGKDRMEQKERSAVLDRKERLPILDKAQNRMRGTLPRSKNNVKASNNREVKHVNSSADNRISGVEVTSLRKSSLGLPDIRSSDAAFKTFQERKDIFSVTHSSARNSSAARSS